MVHAQVHQVGAHVTVAMGYPNSAEVDSAVAQRIDLGRAYTESDSVLWVPSDRTLVAGPVVWLGFHPAAWSASLPDWHAALDWLVTVLRPAAVVPGYGPVTGLAGLTDFRNYLEHLITEIGARFERGMPVEDAAVDVPIGRWKTWVGPENLAYTVAGMYRELGGPAMSAQAAEVIAAEIAAGLRPRPRIAPLAPGDRDERVAEMLGLANGEAAIFELHKQGPPNVHTTLARHPDLYEQTVPLARGIVTGLLPDREREMTILRVAWACGAVYQWSHHRLMAPAAGLTDDEVDGLSQPIAKGGWTERETAVLSLVDELHASARPSEECWTAVAAHFTDAQLIELVTLIGFYHMVSFQLNSWRVPVEAWVAPIRLPSGWPA